MSRNGKKESAELDVSGLPQLPKGWCWTTTDELFTFVTSGSRGWAKYYSESGPLFLRVGNLDHGSISLDLRSIERVRVPDGPEAVRTKVQPGDILISITADVGMVALVPEIIEESYVSQHVSIARPTACVFRPYLAWYLASQHGGQRQFLALQRGATKQGLGLDDIRAVHVPLAPLAEQPRIVAKIEELFSDLDAGVAALERVQANLKRYRAAILKAAVEGRLTAEWRKKNRIKETGPQVLARIVTERRRKWEEEQLTAFAKAGKTPPAKWKEKYKEPAVPDCTNLPALPEGWCWASVEQVAEFARYGSSAKTSSEPSGVPVLRMGNIQDGSLDLADLKYLPFDHTEFPSLLLETGDLLFNRTNSAELVGKSAVYRGQTTPCSYASYLIAVRFLQGCESRYVCHFINSAHGRAWIASVVSQQVGQANVNGTKLQHLAFPLPPRDEQLQIIAEVEERLSVLEEADAQVAANLTRSTLLRQSILKQAFEGKLVPQDPTDDPASALLSRIATARQIHSVNRTPNRPSGRAVLRAPGRKNRTNVGE